MVRDDQTGSNGVDRRDVLTAMTAAGAGLTLPRSVRATPDDRVEIRVEQRPTGEYRTKEVSEGWWTQMTDAREVQRRYNRQFRADERVADVRLSAGDEWLGDHRRGVVTVYVKPDAERPDVPSSAGDVPIRLREYDPDGQPLDTCNTGTEDPVSAGWQIESDPDGTIFSSSSRVEDPDGIQRLSTCAHGFSPCESSGQGDEVTMSDDSYEIGNVDELREDLDYAAVGTSTDDDISGYNGYVDRPDESPTELDITGWLTENGVMDLVGTDETVYKTGRTSCTTSGVADEMYVTDGICDKSDGHYVHATMTTESGDSGAPYYVERYSQDFNKRYAAIVVAAHKGLESQGIAAYRVHNELNYDFG